MTRLAPISRALGGLTSLTRHLSEGQPRKPVSWSMINGYCTQKGEAMDHLWGLYEHWCMEELISLREFVTRLKAGEFGAFSRDEVVGFLREIEASMLENIELKASENPMLEELKEERREETSQEIDELIAEWDR